MQNIYEENLWNVEFHEIFRNSKKVYIFAGKYHNSAAIFCDKWAFLSNIVLPLVENVARFNLNSMRHICITNKKSTPMNLNLLLFSNDSIDFNATVK